MELDVVPVLSFDTTDPNFPLTKSETNMRSSVDAFSFYDSDEEVGRIILESGKVPTRTNRDVFFHQTYVDKFETSLRARGKGVGRAMDLWLKETYFPSILVCTSLNSVARSFWIHMGWVPVDAIGKGVTFCELVAKESASDLDDVAWSIRH